MDLIAQAVAPVFGALDYNFLSFLDLLDQLLQINPLIAIFIAAMAILMMVSVCVLVHKAEEPWWSQLIPIYNLYVMAKITFGNGWYCLYILIAVIPIIGQLLVSLIVLYQLYLLSKAFGMGILNTIGLIFVPFIILPFMAFSKNVDFCGPQFGR